MKQDRLDVLHVDDAIIVVNKPAHLLAVPDRFDKTLPDARSMMQAKYGEAFVVHRIDRETSGVMVFGRTAEAHRHLSLQFEHHQVGKFYHAILSGVIDADALPISIPIAPDPRRKGAMKPSARGKEAHTELTVLERFRVATYVQARLITGRQHQIRVHCAAVGHPLLVDALYGRTDRFLLSTIKRKYNLAKDTEERPVIQRQTLHAHHLDFSHPLTNEAVSFEAPLPRDFAATLQVLRKYAAPYESTFDMEFF
jgi:RluA family pseudouridine synthase